MMRSMAEAFERTGNPHYTEEERRVIREAPVGRQVSRAVEKPKYVDPAPLGGPRELPLAERVLREAKKLCGVPQHIIKVEPVQKPRRELRLPAACPSPVDWEKARAEAERERMAADRARAEKKVQDMWTGFGLTMAFAMDWTPEVGGNC